MEPNKEAVPALFRCPISLEIMKDPVTPCTGITYDRPSIETWFHSYNNHTCPVTNQLLPSLDLTPNHTLLRMIQAWSQGQITSQPEPVLTASTDTDSGEEPVPPASPRTLQRLATELSGPGAASAAATLASASVGGWDFLSAKEFEGLVGLLNAGDSESMASMKVLANACSNSRRNTEAAVSAGAVPVLLELLAETERVSVSERILWLLHVLARAPVACLAVADHALAVPLLCRNLVRVSDVATAVAVATLRRLCKASSRRFRVLQEMMACGAVTKLVWVLQMGCDPAIRKRALWLLRKLSNEFQGSPCFGYSERGFCF